MGNEGSSDSDSGSDSNSGMNEHCYQVGYEHCSPSSEPDAIGDGIDAAPCTFNEDSNN